MALPTQRAALAAAHPPYLVEPETTPTQRDPATIHPLVGCMTGVANVVSEHLARVDLPPKVTRFLRCLERATFGWAGAHRAQGREQPGVWCPFVLAEWVEHTQMSRSQILHVRARLVEDRLIWYEADEAVRGRGRIGWNLDVALWKPLQPEYPRWGGARPGAGRPRKGAAETGVVNLKNESEDMRKGVAPARSTPDEKSSVQLGEAGGKTGVHRKYIVTLKNHQADVGEQDVSARSTPEGNSRLQQRGPVQQSRFLQPGNSRLQHQAESQENKRTTPASAEPAQGATSDQMERRGVRKKIPETPNVVSAAADAAPQAQGELARRHQATDEKQSALVQEPLPDAGAAPDAALPVLQVPAEQLVLWRADVAEQRQVMAQAQAAYERACEALDQCAPGGTGWGELRRQQRYCQHQLEAENAKLAQFSQFVVLIEQGYAKDDACAAVLCQQDEVASTEQEAAGVPVEEAAEATPPEEIAAAPRPRLEGQALRRALFGTLARLFTNGDPRHIDLERGKFNRAIKNFVFAGMQPDDLPVLTAAFERLWPKATCTALGLANNLPLLIGTAEGMGWQFQTAEALRQ